MLISDEILACKTLQGELSAFEELVNRYKNLVFAIVYRMVGQYQEAEDITQEVFITVYDKIYQFDSSKKFKPWIYKIATNASISALRKKKKVITLDFDEVFSKQYEEFRSDYSFDPEVMFERKELERFINEAIMELSDNYRAVIVLRYQMDLSNQEIADVLEITRENVEVKIHRARKALQKIVQKNWAERGMESELPANR